MQVLIRRKLAKKWTHFPNDKLACLKYFSRQKIRIPTFHSHKNWNHLLDKNIKFTLQLLKSYQFIDKCVFDMIFFPLCDLEVRSLVRGASWSRVKSLWRSFLHYTNSRPQQGAEKEPYKVQKCPKRVQKFHQKRRKQDWNFQ